MFELADRFEIEDASKLRRTHDGYLVAAPRVARVGIQLYRGSEVGKPTMDVVRVMRPESEVFQSDSMSSFGYKPVTDNHPPVAVNAANWKDYARGQLGGDVARDGKFIRVPMVLMDGPTIDKVATGKAELSVGYTCDIKWEPGEFEGQQYDAVQTGIRVNHVAVVDQARGGKELRIGDGTGVTVDVNSYAKAISSIAKGKVVVDHMATLSDGDAYLAKDKKYVIGKGDVVYPFAVLSSKTQAIAAGDGDVLAALDSLLCLIEPKAPATPANDGGNKETTKMAQHVIDGITVEMSDTAIQVVTKAMSALTDAFNFEKKKKEEEEEKGKKAKEKADAAIAELTTKAAQQDAQIATLTKQVADSTLTPAKLDALVADRKVVADKARAVLGAALMVDGKTDDEIRAQVVLSKLGDAAKGWTADQMKISFDTLTAGVTIGSGLNDTVAAFSQPHQGGNVTDQKNALYAKRDAKLQDAWKGGATQ